VAAPDRVPRERLIADDFVNSIADHHLVYFLCNVGDADAQVVLLPTDLTAGVRRVVIIDAGVRDKLPALLTTLMAAGLFPDDAAPVDDRVGSIAVMVATHPHLDHVRGLPQVLQLYGDRVAELWDPGYFHTLPDYHELMCEVERRPRLQYTQPTSGLRRYIGNAAVTVLSPSVQLRNRFDTYGTEINDSSISLRIEFPAARVIQRNADRTYVKRPRTNALILGADAQTLSWSYVMTDFPYLAHSGSAAATAIGAATGGDMLRSQVLKVSHHCSKHGVNLELVERVAPRFTLVSSVGGGGKYNFPHNVAQEVVREGLQAIAGGARTRSKDWELGLFYTSDLDDANIELGSIAAVMSPTSTALWRFGDADSNAIDFANARRWDPPTA
jgi:hypothetical protein